MIPRTY